MDDISSARHSRLRRRLLTASMAVLSLAGFVPGTPQDPRATAQDKRPAEILSERLDRNSGVIHPPAGVDPGIAAPVPDPHPNSTPVISPPGTPGGNPSVQPK